jgi:osmotically-inducible protein OsmY
MARNAAAAAAWAIDGVREVDNLVTVRFPPDFGVPTDAEIATSVERSLAWNPDIESAAIGVTVTDGIVRLDGSVDSYWQRWHAEDLVAKLRGVIEVENHLVVVPTETYLDKDIARDIEAALERNVYVDAAKITVKVEEGRVTLTGTVPSYYARGRAYEAAAFTSGVLDVDNNLVVHA